jgi:hypothetical protein
MEELTTEGTSAEAAVGITEYATTTPGFSGILKHRCWLMRKRRVVDGVNDIAALRYRDFQVHEIDKADNVARLTTLQCAQLVSLRTPRPAMMEVPDEFPVVFPGANSGGCCAS